MFHEGQMVTSIGDGSDGVPLGSHGHILALTAPGSGHVQWLSGPRTGQVSFLPDLDDTVAASSRRVQGAYSSRDGWEDSLEVGPISTTGARHLMATGGPSNVLYSLASSGAMAETGDLAEEALALVETRLRQTASLQDHLAELDDEDRNEVYRLASRELLGQAFGGTHD
jgi:hypothetical protein